MQTVMSAEDNAFRIGPFSLSSDTVSTRPTAKDNRLGSVVERIRAGDSQAAEELHSILYRGIRFLAQRQIGPIDAEDVAQQTLLITLRAIHNGVIQNPQALPGFARTVAQREVIRILEQRKAARTELTDICLAHVSDPRSNPEEDALAHETQALMLCALRAISDLDREILTRFYLHEQSKEQVCLEMRLTATQFRLLKSRAKARLAEKGRIPVIRRSPLCQDH